MALDARTRSSIYGKFAELLGDHDANALMSEFPSVEADELVTKQFLRAELSVLRAEMSAMRGELRGEIAALGSELRGEIAALGSELRGEIAALGSELRGEIAALGSELHGETGALGSSLRGEIAELRFEMMERFHRQTVWLAGTVVASAGAVIAAIPLLS